MGLRRFYDRYQLNSPATLTDAYNVKREVILRDLSIMGAGIVCAQPIKVYEEVTVVIQHPFFDNPISPKAKVIWCKKLDKDYWRLGLIFTERKLTFA